MLKEKRHRASMTDVCNCQYSNGQNRKYMLCYLHKTNYNIWRMWITDIFFLTYFFSKKMVGAGNEGKNKNKNTLTNKYRYLSKECLVLAPAALVCSWWCNIWGVSVSWLVSSTSGWCDERTRWSNGSLSLRSRRSSRWNLMRKSNNRHHSEKIWQEKRHMQALGRILLFVWP